MKIVSIVGARPQFIKAVVVSAQIRKSHEELLVHTGQHYDFEMSDLFFDELELPKPNFNLEVGSSSHAKQTGKMMEMIEDVLVDEKPDCTIVYGDTNSTLAGALASAKSGVPVAHVEAGLRSFDRSMPEEINRVLTDHLSELLFCPTELAVENLAREGIERCVHVVGDVMCDTLTKFIGFAEKHGTAMSDLGVNPKSYVLVTVHRAENTDNAGKLRAIAESLRDCGKRVIFPVHPRTRRALSDSGLLNELERVSNVEVIDPLGYFDFLLLQKNARVLMTDSGGAQKEAYILGVPCLTLRETTEWMETVDDGWNVLVGTDREKILKNLADFSPCGVRRPIYGDGKTSEKIVAILEDRFGVS